MFKDAAPDDDLVSFTGEIVSAYVSHNSISTQDLPGLISAVHAALQSLWSTQPVDVATVQAPAVPINKSITADFIICLEDGEKFKSLKRHLMAHFGMTPDQYRAKWNLPSDYPMVSAAYAAVRSNLAKSTGLGRTREPLQVPARRKSGSAV
ncbi:putative transcriptional regulator [Devosia sp. UYZn731]|uniref:MucR family transcriptional regulator n=1 Tax=Devosia sp. UYZn731 TaxID=3156345 RepID=UPI003396CA4D